MKDTILNFLKSGSGELDLKEICPETLIKTCEEVGMKLDTDNIETNGWHLDYFIYAKYKRKKYLISGSAWYGTATIEIEEQT